MGIVYKVYCPVCHWLLPPGAWRKLEQKLRGKEDIPLGLMQKSDGRTFSRGSNLHNPGDIPVTFPVVKGRLIDAFKLWVSKLWIDEDDWKAMVDWIQERIWIVAGIPLARRITFIEAKAGNITSKEL